MVKQRNNSDCGIAAVANATGKSYAEVKKRFGNVRGGMKSHELEWILFEFGNWKVVRTNANRTLDQWLKRKSKGTYVVSIHSKCLFDEFGHAVAVKDGKVLGEYNPKWFVYEYYKKLD